MKRVKVQFVKYDMTKTKNRKRKDMLVDYQGESAVITQLERIHKGEKVVKIHEIVWDENQPQEQEPEYFYGTVKFFDYEKGFGFIQPEEDMDDLFFHQSACPDGVPNDGDQVEFLLSQSPRGLCAIQVRTVEERF